MSKLTQREAFMKYEADAWFQRNKKILEDFSSENDDIIRCIKNYGIEPKNVLEIGCSAGYRLRGLKNIFPSSEVTGIDPSEEAIKYGNENYKDI